jgi:hypothetical protein
LEDATESKKEQPITTQANEEEQDEDAKEEESEDAIAPFDIWNEPAFLETLQINQHARLLQQSTPNCGSAPSSTNPTNTSEPDSASREPITLRTSVSL